MKVLKSRKGQNMLEYLIIIGGVIVAILALRLVFNSSITNGMTNLATSVDTHMSTLP